MTYLSATFADCIIFVNFTKYSSNKEFVVIQSMVSANHCPGLNMNLSCNCLILSENFELSSNTARV